METHIMARISRRYRRLGTQALGIVGGRKKQGRSVVYLRLVIGAHTGEVVGVGVTHLGQQGVVRGVLVLMDGGQMCQLRGRR